MRIYFGTPGFGWRMYGIGYKSVWFIGFSARIQEGARWSEPNLVHIQFEQETDGRWIAEVPERPGVMAYGETQQEALAKVTRLLEEIEP